MLNALWIFFLHPPLPFFGGDFPGFPPHLQWEGTAVLGPILLEENILEVELPAKPAVLIQTRGAISASEGANLATALNFYAQPSLDCRCRS